MLLLLLLTLLLVMLEVVSRERGEVFDLERLNSRGVVTGAGHRAGSPVGVEKSGTFRALNLKLDALCGERSAFGLGVFLLMVFLLMGD